MDYENYINILGDNVIGLSPIIHQPEPVEMTDDGAIILTGIGVEGQLEKDPEIYKAKAGDSLSKIARMHLGLGNKKLSKAEKIELRDTVEQIAVLNGKQKGADANKVAIGEDIKLPPRAMFNQRADVPNGFWQRNHDDTQSRLAARASVRGTLGEGGVRSLSDDVFDKAVTGTSAIDEIDRIALPTPTIQSARGMVLGRV